MVVQSWRGQGCMCDISAALTPLNRYGQSSPVHMIIVIHFLIKMCQLKKKLKKNSLKKMSVHCLILLLNAWKIFVSSQLENLCTAGPAKDSSERLELNARRMEKVSEVKKRSSIMTHSPPYVLPFMAWNM